MIYILPLHLNYVEYDNIGVFSNLFPKLGKSIIFPIIIFYYFSNKEIKFNFYFILSYSLLIKKRI